MFELDTDQHITERLAELRALFPGREVVRRSNRAIIVLPASKIETPEPEPEYDTSAI